MESDGWCSRAIDEGAHQAAGHTKWGMAIRFAPALLLLASTTVRLLQTNQMYPYANRWIDRDAEAGRNICIAGWVS